MKLKNKFFFLIFLIFFSVNINAIQYSGNYTVCFYDKINHESCLNHSQNFTLDSNSDYLVKLEYENFSESPQKILIGTHFTNVKYVGYSLFAIILIVFLFLFFRIFFNL